MLSVGKKLRAQTSPQEEYTSESETAVFAQEELEEWEEVLNQSITWLLLIMRSSPCMLHV